MENVGVKCDVQECVHNIACRKCDLSTIEVTNQKTGANAVSVPHFCKSYQGK
ncbi:MAG: DUF1540 domain-containing protein [Oscillospiraceae bacterium]|nr:DUF1540 domain-containing protein [Oscillospiraceae bacterium]